MAITGRPKTTLVVTDSEREVLERWVRRGRANRSLAFRARIVLQCASGELNTAVARAMRTTDATVGKWRKRFIDKGLDGLHDEPRPGAARTISDEQVENVVVKTLEATPKGRTHWSTRSMAKNVGLSH